MVPLDNLFTRLARSPFRSRFKLGVKERQYCYDKGPDVIDSHAAILLPLDSPRRSPKTMASKRQCAGIRCLSPSTPRRPAVASVSKKWHNIPAGTPLDDAQQHYIVGVIHHWLVIQMNKPQS